MFDRPISWGELITIVLFLLGAALLFYLILAIANLVRILKNVNRIIDKNKDNINQTIEKLPKIASNAEKITETVKNNMEAIDKVVQDVGKISSSVKKGVETFQKDILNKAKIFLDIINAIKAFFEKRKKSPSKKKGTTVYRYKYRKDQEKPDEVEILTSEEMDEGPYEDYEADTSEEEQETGSDESSDEDSAEAATSDTADDEPDVSAGAPAAGPDDSGDIQGSADREDAGN